MLVWTIQIILISILFIFLVHHLICFLKNTLTIPKTKDLVRSTNKKYDTIYSVINQTPLTDSSYIDLLPVAETPSTNMKDELKNFLKSTLLEGNQGSPTTPPFLKYV